MSITKMGYKKNSPYKNRKSLTINSNLITTENMANPILAVSDTGDTKVLYPDTGEYKFKGNMVKEYKLQKGGVQTPRESLQNVPVPYMDKVNGLSQDRNAYYQERASKPNLISERMETRSANLPGKKFRFKEKQEGGVQLNEYLESLSPEDQDRFVDEYENASDKDDFMMKCGGIKQEGGYYFTKGKFQLGGVPQVPEQYANSEVEGGETILSEGMLKEVEGPKHSDGGVPTILQEGDQVFSEYLMVPDEVKKAVLGKNTKKKYTFADLSKKFDTKPNFEILEDIDSDEYERNHAELKLQTNTAMLQTLFTAQEMAKENEKPMKTSYKTGGMYKYQKGDMHPGSYDLSTISKRFKQMPDGSLLDPTHNERYTRNADGTYTPFQEPNSDYSLENSDKFPGMRTQPVQVSESDLNSNPYIFPPLSKDDVAYKPSVKDRFPSMRTQPANPVGGSLPDNFNPLDPVPYKYTGPEGDKDGYVGPNGLWVPPTPTLSKPKSSVRRQAETKVSGNTATPNNVPNPNDPWNTSLSTLPGLEFSPVTSDRGAPALPPDSHLTPVTNTTSVKQSWYQRNKDKFGINSKLAGTILDIGMTLSDKLRVNEPMLYDHQKQPMFNRFYEFDNKEVQRLANQQIQGIMNSNLPEAVKQAQIAEVTANSQDNQGKVDFANAQRYEGKREQDLSKLQTYQDANVDSRISDFDNYRQRKAKVDYLRDKFKAQKKERVYNSARGYFDYVEELGVANELSPYFTINPITGRTQYKPQNKSKLENNLISQYAQNSNNTTQLPNGVTAVQMGDKTFLITADGKDVTQVK